MIHTFKTMKEDEADHKNRKTKEEIIEIGRSLYYDILSVDEAEEKIQLLTDMITPEK